MLPSKSRQVVDKNIDKNNNILIITCISQPLYNHENNTRAIPLALTIFSSPHSIFILVYPYLDTPQKKLLYLQSNIRFIKVKKAPVKIPIYIYIRSCSLRNNPIEIKGNISKCGK